MKLIPKSASDDDILSIVREWTALLAQDDYEGAFKITRHDDYYQWTPELISTVIKNYGSIEPLEDGHVCQVTPIESATGDNSPRHEVDRTCDPWKVWFDLPLDGEWSDLTATFSVFQDDVSLGLVLNEIHIF